MVSKDNLLLIELIKKGDKLAFKHLFETTLSPLCRYISIYLKDRSLSEDFAIDIFTYIWENKENLEIKISLKAYIFQMARNKCLNYLRDKKVFVDIENLDANLEYTEILSLEIKELELLIQEAVTSLPDKCKDVFLKSRSEKLTNNQIADKLNISVKTVEAQITKSLKIIKKHLKKNDFYLF